MFDDPRLLVVDDEELICQGCQRIFSPQGFRVETCMDASDGLNLASKEDYAAVLLDIKMPTMNGIQFLEELRKVKPDLPVIIVTGYPTIPNAASAMRLGVSDYIAKPFTPEAITQAVQRLLPHHDTKKREESVSASPTVEPWVPESQERRFWDESWFQRGKDGVVRVGALLTRGQAANVEAVRLPRIGDMVYQGLPLAGLTTADGSQRTVSSPVSGVVVTVNDRLAQRSSMLRDDPCGNGWIACLSPLRLEEEAGKCSSHRVVLVNPDEDSAHAQNERLTSLGCQVRIAGTWEQLSPLLQDSDCQVLIMDASWFGEHGPEIIARINAAAPSMRIVVAASAEPEWETAYRENTIFHYAVEPFADNEIVDILDAAFRPQGQLAPQVEHLNASLDSISQIRITNRDGEKVCLLAASGLLRRAEGLGRRVRAELLNRRYPVETRLGNARVTPTEILRAASAYDRLLLLLAKDTGRLPGSLARDAKGEFVSVPGEDADKITMLLVQPDPHGGGLLEFDIRTTAALTEHIVNEMTAGRPPGEAIDAGPAPATLGKQA